MRTLLACLMISISSVALSSTASEKILKLIARDLDSLVGDTVNEGSWDANLVTNELGFPSGLKCVGSSDAATFTCDATFILTPYPEDLDHEPWKVTCTALVYTVSTSGRSTRVFGEEQSLGLCLEALNEGP